jgi:alkylation response protein AidB-like acyl-CoA dehydrogenase
MNLVDHGSVKVRKRQKETVRCPVESPALQTNNLSRALRDKVLVDNVNGIVADYNVARFFADAEALYSYEGTYQMQNLIVGKAITGLGAFV